MQVHKIQQLKIIITYYKNEISMEKTFPTTHW